MIQTCLESPTSSFPAKECRPGEAARRLAGAAGGATAEVESAASLRAHPETPPPHPWPGLDGRPGLEHPPVHGARTQVTETAAHGGTWTSTLGSHSSGPAGPFHTQALCPPLKPRHEKRSALTDTARRTPMSGAVSQKPDERDARPDSTSGECGLWWASCRDGLGGGAGRATGGEPEGPASRSGHLSHTHPFATSHRRAHLCPCASRL